MKKSGFKILSFKKKKSKWVLNLKPMDKSFNAISLEITRTKPAYISKVAWKDSLDNTSEFRFFKIKPLKKPLKGNFFSLPKNSTVSSL